MDKQEYSMVIEGTLRLQNNIKIAKTKYGNIFYGRIINTNYFEDEQVIPTLVASDDISLILGKPRYPESFTNNEYKIKLIDKNNCGLYSIEVLKDNVDDNKMEIIRLKLCNQIETISYCPAHLLSQSCSSFTFVPESFEPHGPELATKRNQRWRSPSHYRAQ